MELHHKNHHNTYVTSFNNFSSQLSELQSSSSSSSPGSIAQQIALQPMINFHGGGHINHSLFWENLAPKSSGGGEPPSGKLGKEIEATFGGVEGLKKVMNAKLAGIQGSGWAWLVKDKETGGIGVRTYAVSHSCSRAPGKMLSVLVEPRSRHRTVCAAAGNRCVGTRLLVSF